MANHRCLHDVSILACGTQGGLLAGRRVVQLHDHSFAHHMHDYARDKLTEISAPRGPITFGKPFDDDFLSQLRGVAGAINCPASMSRPDMAAASSIIPGPYAARDATASTLANKVAQQAKQTDVFIHTWPIDPHNIRWVAICDGSYDGAKKERRQLGYVLGTTTPALSQGKHAQKMPMGGRVTTIRGGQCSRRRT